jgi:hypothetical protein
MLKGSVSPHQGPPVHVPEILAIPEAALCFRADRSPTCYILVIEGVTVKSTAVGYRHIREKK